ncbi:MAG: PEP-CTERM sorting domain-containing protein [bacterium]
MWKRIIQVVIFLNLILITNYCWALPVADFLSTGSLELSRVISTYSGTATFSFDIDKNSIKAEYGYLNVVGNNDSWVIQNVPLYLNAEIAEERNHVWFYDFDNSVGTSETTIYSIINDQPLAGPPVPDGSWQSASITPDEFTWGIPEQAGESGPPIPANPPTTPPPPPDTAVIESFLRGGVYDLKQYKMECGPTSTANSLIWLAKKYNLLDKLPKKPDGTVDEQQLILDLAKIMKPGWNPAPVVNNNRGYPGLLRGELEAGKKKYMIEKKLPITVHGGVDDPNAQGQNTFEFVKKELKRGQDVEFLIAWPGDGYHWVTVVGFIDAGPRNMLIVHDPLKANGNNYWEIDDFGRLSSPVGTANRAVAESYAPEPSSFILLILGLLGIVGIKKRLN